METKKRHGCVTAWLILMIIANSITAISYLLMGDTILENLPNPTSKSTLILLAILGLANLAFAILLFQWKKWAFWGFTASALITLVINLSIGLSIGQSLLGLLGFILLYVVLQIKQDGKTAWENLE